MYPPVPTAVNSACLTACAQAAVTTGTGRFMPSQAKKQAALRKLRIGIDIMGSENPPDVLLKTAEALAPEVEGESQLIAIGHPRYATHSTLAFRPAESTIEMDDSPITAIRRKPNSSLCIGLKMLREKEIDAFVSAGNTGALVVCAKRTCGMMPGLLRPALLALIPTRREPLAVLDVGANVQCKAAHLVQFALLGAAYKKAKGMALPSVGLLNIGEEAIKGTSELRLAYSELRQLADLPHPFFHFAGNIEGKSVFDGQIDVLITDGFTGNIFLKTAEGIASLILDRLNEKLPLDTALQMQSHLLDLHRHLHYAEYPGALLCGIRGIVIKCHGYSSREAFRSGIREAVKIAREGFLQIIQDKLVNA